MTKHFILFLMIVAATAWQAVAQTNDYYTRTEARSAIDNILSSYGGQERIKSVQKLKVVMRMHIQNRRFQVKLCQKADKIRIEWSGDQNMVQVFDGEQAFLMTGSQVVPAPPALTADLQSQVQKGIGQQSLLAKYLGRQSHVRFHGLKKYKEQELLVLETIDARGSRVDHYFDTKTNREVVEITHRPSGDEVQHFDSYRMFGGVLYPEKTSILSAAGDVIGGMELVEITDQFEDSVFRLDR